MTYWYQEWPTGSTYFNGVGEDVDIVRYVAEEDANVAIAELISEGYAAPLDPGLEYTGNEDVWAKQATFRKGAINLILTWDPLLYIKWVAFSQVAALVRFGPKVYRIELSKAIVEDDTEAALNVLRLSEFHEIAGQLAAYQRSKAE